MFPYLCLGTLPIFCAADWPKRVTERCWGCVKRVLPSTEKAREESKRRANAGWRPLKAAVMGLYVVVQLTLPWSHGVTQGYNNWTNGLYGYSWDMMVHAWQTMHVVVSVKHKSTGHISYLDTDVKKSIST